jgi:hypothetical protein
MDEGAQITPAPRKFCYCAKHGPHIVHADQMTLDVTTRLARVLCAAGMRSDSRIDLTAHVCVVAGG